MRRSISRVMRRHALTKKKVDKDKGKIDNTLKEQSKRLVTIKIFDQISVEEAKPDQRQTVSL